MSEAAVVNDVVLPAAGVTSPWDAILIEDDTKDRLLRQALLSLALRRAAAAEHLGLHGLILLVGPPGTGKTTLARGIAHRLAPLTTGRKCRLIEINPHELMSAEHGQTQQAVHDLLFEIVPSRAADGLPTVLVLDEVETLVVARSAANMTNNPADVHRATDAALTALDHCAQQHPHLLVVATSNFPETIDEALSSRADAIIPVPLPSARAAALILSDTLKALGRSYPSLAAMAEMPELAAIGASLVGIDGRRIRKIVVEAMARREEPALDPNKLRLDDLRAAAAAETAGAGAIRAAA